MSSLGCEGKHILGAPKGPVTCEKEEQYLLSPRLPASFRARRGKLIK